MSEIEILKLNTLIGNARFDMVLKEGYYLVRGSDFPRLHCHPDFELHCIEKGTCTYRLERGALHLSAPALVLFPPKTYHGFESMTEDCEKCCFEFSLSQHGEGNSYFSYQTLLSSLSEGIVLQTGFPSVTRFLSMKMDEEGRYLLSQTLGEVLITAIRKVRDSATQKEQNLRKNEEDLRESEKDMEKNMLLGKIVAYIEKHYRDPITLSDAAREACLSERQVERILKSGMQEGFLQILNRYRVRMAVHQMMDGNRDLETVAEEAGFQSYITFWKHFRRFTGTSPSEFLMNLRER